MSIHGCWRHLKSVPCDVPYPARSGSDNSGYGRKDAKKWPYHDANGSKCKAGVKAGGCGRDQDHFL